MRGCCLASTTSTSCSSRTPTRHGPPRSQLRSVRGHCPRSRRCMDAADAIVIAAATDAHADLVRAGDRASPADLLREAARRRRSTRPSRSRAESEACGVPFQLGFQRRFDAGYREAHRMVDSGRARHASTRSASPATTPRRRTSRTSRSPADCSGIFPSTTSMSSAGCWDGGGGGLRRRWRPGLPGVRQVRRRRHRRGDPAHGRTGRSRC